MNEGKKAKSQAGGVRRIQKDGSPEERQSRQFVVEGRPKESHRRDRSENKRKRGKIVMSDRPL